MMRVINENTPLSMGIATAFVAVAVSLGMGIEHFRFRMTHVERAVAQQTEWRHTVDGILAELKDLNIRHEWRLNRLEQSASAEPTPVAAPSKPTS